MDPFLGEIRLMPYLFTTRGWAPCQGQTMSISQNTALFSLLGVQYGGDGRTTFNLPDLRGRAIVGMGQGAGLTNYPQGTLAGSENVTLASDQMPMHIHTLGGTVPVSGVSGAANTPDGNYFAANADGEPYGSPANHGPMAQMLSGTSGPAGSGQQHSNLMPFLALSYCIAIQGIFPQRQ